MRSAFIVLTHHWTVLLLCWQPTEIPECVEITVYCENCRYDNWLTPLVHQALVQWYKSVYTTGNTFLKVLENNGPNAGTVCKYTMTIVQVSLITCPSARQVYCILNLHQLGHPVPAAMLRCCIFGKNKTCWFVHILQCQYCLYRNTYTAAGQVGSRQEGMGSSRGLDMSEAFVGFPSSSRQVAGPGLMLTAITASYLMCTWGSSPCGKGVEAWNQLHNSI
jgi:hypothetical protein